MPFTPDRTYRGLDGVPERWAPHATTMESAKHTCLDLDIEKLWNGLYGLFPKVDVDATTRPGDPYHALTQD